MSVYPVEDIRQATYDHNDKTFRASIGVGNDDVLVDEASATITYIGRAVPGSNPASAVWQIKKVSVSGAVTTIAWADGDTKYDNVWANRATLTYNTY